MRALLFDMDFEDTGICQTLQRLQRRPVITALESRHLRLLPAQRFTERRLSQAMPGAVGGDDDAHLVRQFQAICLGGVMI